MSFWTKTGLGPAACRTSGGEHRGVPVELLPWGNLEDVSAHLLLNLQFMFASPLSFRDQREEELGEYYMKKYAKSSVGET